LFEGIAKYGMEDWDKIIRDNELWIRPEDKREFYEEPWRIIFKKIEGKTPALEQEDEAYK
jgi:hypothetical protein